MMVRNRISPMKTDDEWTKTFFQYILSIYNLLITLPAGFEKIWKIKNGLKVRIGCLNLVRNV